MPVQADNRAIESLNELIARIRPGDLMAADRWLGMRRAPRSRVLVPSVVRLRPRSDPTSSITCELRDISSLGLGLAVHGELEPCQPVFVELHVGGVHWAGEMCVVHCTHSARGYRVGLMPGCHVGIERDLDPAPAVEEPDDEPVSLERIRAEIHAAVRAYRRAQASWGLLGASVEARITRAIQTLPPLPENATHDSRREHPRYPVVGDVQVVLASRHAWKHLRGRINDISLGGAKLLVAMKATDDFIERELIGDFGLRPQIVMIVGVETAEETLWLPARIIHCFQHDRLAQLGVSFLTGRLLRTVQL